MDKLKYVKIENEDGSLSDNIPLGVDAENVDTANGSSNLNKDLLNIQSTLRTQEKELNLLNSQVSSWSNINPIAVDSIEDMTDTSKIYVLITDGNWYYYNDSWISGGVYQASVPGPDISNLQKNSTKLILKISKDIFVNFNEDKSQLHIYTDFSDGKTLTVYTNNLSFNITKNINKTFVNTDFDILALNYIFINQDTKEVTLKKFGSERTENDCLLAIIDGTGSRLYTPTTFFDKNNPTEGILYFNNTIANQPLNSNSGFIKFLGINCVIYINTLNETDTTYDVNIELPYSGKINAIPFSQSINATNKTFNSLVKSNKYVIGINFFNKTLFAKDDTQTLDFGDCVFGFLYNGIFRSLNITSNYNMFFNNIPANPMPGAKDNAYIANGGKIYITLENNILTVNIKNNVLLLSPNSFGSFPSNKTYTFNLEEGTYENRVLAIVASTYASEDYRIRPIILNSEINTLQSSDIIIAYINLNSNIYVSNCQNNVHFNGEDISINGRTLKNVSQNIVLNNEFDFLRCFEHFTMIGDSLSAGFTHTNNMESSLNEKTDIDTREIGVSWFNYLMNRLNKTGNNQSVSGSNCNWWRNNYINNVLGKTDCYFIALGVNDLNDSNISVGSTSDINADYNLNANTFYGNYDFIIRKITEANPYSKIFVFTLPNNYSSSKANDISNAIRYFAETYNNVFLVDIREKLNQAPGSFIGKFWVKGHLEPIGYNYISVQFEKLLNDVISENYQDFMEIPLTNYEGFPIIQ